MNTEITDRTHVLVLKGNAEFYINQAEYDGIKKIMESDQNMFEVQGNLISRDSVLYMVRASDFKQVENKRRGMWQCSKGTWHKKEFTECSC